MPSRLSLVVPLYKTGVYTQPVIERWQSLQTSLNSEIELVCVDDGCPDGSGKLMEEALAQQGLPGKVAFLSRNFGSFEAIRAGMSECSGDAIVVMAADLQEPADLTEDMFRELKTGEVDVIVGSRAARKGDPIFSAMFSKMFWWFFRKFVIKNIPKGGVDIFGCTKTVAQSILTLSERNTSLIGLLFWIGYRRKNLEYERQKRSSGKSGWSFSRKLKYMMDSVFAFTDLPIKLLSAIGLVGMVVSVALGLLIFTMRITGQIQTVGYSALMVAILAQTSLMLLALSIVGDYVWRTFENSKRRPGFIVRSVSVLNATQKVNIDKNYDKSA